MTSAAVVLRPSLHEVVRTGDVAATFLRLREAAHGDRDDESRRRGKGFSHDAPFHR
jgi:hypothetical protein